MGELPPSDSRRREARAQGRVACSPIATATGALLGGGLAIWGTAPAAATALSRFAAGTWGAEAAIGGALERTLSLAMELLGPIALCTWAGAWLVGLAQTRGLFSLGPFARRTRQPGGPAPAVPWALATLLVMLGVWTARQAGPALARAATLEATGAAVLEAVIALGPRALLLLAVASLGDWAWRRVRLDRSLWMTRAERQRERRQQEADPRLRAEARRRGRG